MTKKVNLTIQPTPRMVPPGSAEQWVDRRTSEATKRLTLDVPASLHARIKATCALRGVKMVDEITQLLEEHFPQLSAESHSQTK